MSVARVEAGRRVKWEPFAAMVVLLVLSGWLVVGGADAGITAREGAFTSPIRVANTRGVVDYVKEGGEESFVVRTRDGWSSASMSAGAFRAAFGPAAYEEVSASRTNWVFRLFNITSWAGVAWVGLGLLGQFAFTGRMLIQWFVSEQNRRSTVPAVFWWLSLVGAGALFAYFTWRQDVVGVLGQASGVVIYVRNLRLIGKERRRAERGAE